MIKIGTALFEACEELERERGISKDVLIASLCDAMVAAYKKHMHVKEAANIEAILDEQTGEIGVFSTKVVVKSGFLHKSFPKEVAIFITSIECVRRV